MVLNLLVWEWFFLIGGSIGRSSTRLWLRRGWIQPNPIPTNPRVYPASPPHTGNETTRSRRALLRQRRRRRRRRRGGHLSLAALTACPTAAGKCASSCSSPSISSSASSPSRSPALLLIPFFLVRVRQAAALTAATPAPALIRTAAAPPGAYPPTPPSPLGSFSCHGFYF
uniref:Uncharacterized protein n=1 Tax=Setaria italica TaxID=4555 RepID=K4AKW3_SETIT